MTLTGRALRLSRTVARLAQSSAVVTRKHTITDRTNHKVASMVTDGVTALGATSVTLQNGTSGDSFSGLIPSGLTLTIAGNDYTVSADVEEDRATDRITVTLTSGLLAEAPDETAVTLGNAVTDTHSKVNLRPASTADVDRGQAQGRAKVSYVAAFPGHLATRWITKDATIVYTFPDGRTAQGGVEILENATWGQRVYS